MIFMVEEFKLLLHKVSGALLNARRSLSQPKFFLLSKPPPYVRVAKLFIVMLMNQPTAHLRAALLLAFAVIIQAGLSSCALQQKQTPKVVVEEPVPAPPLFEWTDESTTGKPSVKISLSEQKAYVYRGGKNVAWSMLASGVEGHRSPTGSFSVLEKIVDKKSNLYGIIVNADGEVVNWDAKQGVSSIPKGGHFEGAPMTNWMRLTHGGVGMHKGDIPNPGQPASHGCIRLPGEFASKLYSVVDIGTPVTVTGVAP
jgi:lipoprotein-anchoring transpeptidase ErfK/SrfK